MTRDEARERIKSSISCLDYLKKSKYGNYECPRGEHGNNTGAVKYYQDTNTWYCHQCRAGGDVLDLMQYVEGLDYNQALTRAADQLHITIDHEYTPRKAPQEAQEPAPAQEEPQEKPNYQQYYRECKKRITDPAAVSYLTGRGISLETAKAYWIGYDPEADPANAPGAMGDEIKPHPTPRIIVPVSDEYFIGRAIDPNTPKAFAKMNPKGSTPGIFNEIALWKDEPVIFVTEGVFDALSIIEAGYPAIAINSTSNADSCIKKIEQRSVKATLILTLDNDSAGTGSTRILREGLNRLNVKNIVGDICNGHKDPNEALVADRGGFIDAIKKEIERTSSRPDNTRLYIDRLMIADIERFRKAGELKTGYRNLDEMAGGLYSGLYVLAATSSLGKTTWALQLADQIAAAGRDVIFFSLEQSRLELVSKSIARITAQQDPAHAVNALQIRQGHKFDEVLDAIDDYKEHVADRLSIVEGNFNCDLPFISEYVTQYIRQNGEDHRPVVIVDYLQILTPYKDERGRTPSAREAVDAAVTGLKRMSRTQDLTVIVISSVNRANYQQPIDFESLKESGGIEYSADVVYGLQLQCLNDDLFNQEKKIKEKREKIRQEKDKSPREIELVCLKNRYGRTNFSCYFNYYAENDLFEPTGTDTPQRRQAARRL